MTTTHGSECTACGHVNPGEAQFCNACGAKLEAAPPPQPEPPKFVEVPASILGGDHAEHTGRRTTPLFYLYVFLALGIITITEIFLTQTGPAAFWVTTLLVLSTAKFALVAMFFMHLSGDRRMFSLLFLGPLLLGGAILVSLVGLFREF
ncbi:MAG: cytochrome C oxidase subunit IV family protein [Dehalococcoidia bacterium]